MDQQIEEKEKEKEKAKYQKRKEFLKELDQYALRLQKNPNDEEAFKKIHDALNKFIMGQAFHRFIIRGYEGNDLCQEALIVLWSKAIPCFNPERGMSFWGFAKMCINRHLITILNSALTRKKDMPMNKSVSLDEIFVNNDSDGGDGCTLMNLFDDGTDFLNGICSSEDQRETLIILKESLSPFETMVLLCYLEGMSYKEISKNISEDLERFCNEKSVDNALLRIRRKAMEIIKEKKLPLFI